MGASSLQNEMFSQVSPICVIWIHLLLISSTMYTLCTLITHLSINLAQDKTVHSKMCNGFIKSSATLLEKRDIRGAFGKLLAWYFISVTDLQTLSCLVPF